MFDPTDDRLAALAALDGPDEWELAALEAEIIAEDPAADADLWLSLAEAAHEEDMKAHATKQRAASHVDPARD